MNRRDFLKLSSVIVMPAAAITAALADSPILGPLQPKPKPPEPACKVTVSNYQASIKAHGEGESMVKAIQAAMNLLDESGVPAEGRKVHCDDYVLLYTIDDFRVGDRVRVPAAPELVLYTDHYESFNYRYEEYLVEGEHNDVLIGRLLA